MKIIICSTTGFAVNPARDFGPRFAHSVLPIPGKVSIIVQPLP